MTITGVRSAASVSWKTTWTTACTTWWARSVRNCYIKRKRKFIRLLNSNILHSAHNYKKIHYLYGLIFGVFFFYYFTSAAHTFDVCSMLLLIVADSNSEKTTLHYSRMSSVLTTKYLTIAKTSKLDMTESNLLRANKTTITTRSSGTPLHAEVTCALVRNNFQADTS